MARKRSLKDAAADRLVEKNKTVPETPPPPARKKAARSGPVKAASEAPPAENPVVPPPEPEAPQPPAVEVPEPAEELKRRLPPLVWKGIPILIGCVAGYFFGLGHATGPASMLFLLIGLAAGYLLGRFTKTT
ncbi:MAG: hypothetical protein MUC33_00550 [Desulfobacterales bacterium]|jgi:hypothetical protein|nr:hypothetical protein [Desulfobacterales bacterium]